MLTLLNTHALLICPCSHKIILNGILFSVFTRLGSDVTEKLAAHIMRSAVYASYSMYKERHALAYLSPLLPLITFYPININYHFRPDLDTSIESHLALSMELCLELIAINLLSLWESPKCQRQCENTSHEDKAKVDG